MNDDEDDIGENDEVGISEADLDADDGDLEQLLEDEDEMAEDEMEEDIVATSKKMRGLGRGLNALFEDEEAIYPQVSPDGDTPGRARTMIGIDEIARCPTQPRGIFHQDTLAELAESIKAHGILQPLLLRPHGPSGPFDGENVKYQIIAGERRWQAAQIAGLHEVPAVILHDIDDVKAFEIALIENLQREDLDPIDEAEGYKRMSAEYGFTQAQIAESVGKSRSHIANSMRLLELPGMAQAYLCAGDLSVGHARALLSAKDPAKLAKEVIEKGLSVRQTEKLVAEDIGRAPAKSAGGKGAGKASDTFEKDTDTLALERDLSAALGMTVSIDTKDGLSGKVTISFKTLDQLDDILGRISGVPAGRLSG